MPEDIKLYLRTKASCKDGDGFSEVSGGSIFTKPTLLCCGGMNITHDYPNMANGFAKRGLALLGCIETNGHAGFQTATVTYAAETSENTAQFYNRGQMPADMYKRFITEQLEPLFADHQGNKISVDEVKKNFRNINVLAHSFGGIFIQQVGNLLVDRMKEVGFSDDEIRESTSQILVVTAGNVADILGGKASFTQINILQRHDAAASEDSKNASLMEGLLDGRKSRSDLAAFRCRQGDYPFDIRQEPDAPNMLVCTTRETRPEVNVMRCDDADCKTIVGDTKDERFHGVPTYFNYSFAEYGLILRTMMSAVLANGLNNSIANEKQQAFTPLPEHEDLLQLPKTLSFTATPDKDFRKIGNVIGYQERIGAMLGQEPKAEIAM